MSVKFTAKNSEKVKPGDFVIHRKWSSGAGVQPIGILGPMNGSNIRVIFWSDGMSCDFDNAYHMRFSGTIEVE